MLIQSPDTNVFPLGGFINVLFSPPLSTLLLALFIASIIYTLHSILTTLHSLHKNLSLAQTLHPIPYKVLPFPPGLFSFFAFQLLRSLGLLEPGTRLHALLSMGRPDGYGMHEELGDAFLTVSPTTGLCLIIADPKLARDVNSKRNEFPKPPNTGAIINIYGRNVINTDSDQWRFHRRVTGPVFSERIHGVVWREGRRQALLMLSSFTSSSHSIPGDSPISVPSIAPSLLRLTLNVITGSAYGHPLGWTTNPPSTQSTPRLNYSEAMESLTAHLMPLFLTPHWLLRLAPRTTTWGKAWEAYEAFGGYMSGMLAHQKSLPEESQGGNLLTALLAAQLQDDEKLERPMDESEVMGNMFIMLFAGHETTANTLHYSLLLLALHPEIQELLLSEIDSTYLDARFDDENDDGGELIYERDFQRGRWVFAILYETLRLYTPTGMTNKFTSSPQPVTFNGQTFVIPEKTRISINGTAIHRNKKVWGEDCDEWKPARWIVSEGQGPSWTPVPSRSGSPAPRSPGWEKRGFFDQQQDEKPRFLPVSRQASTDNHKSLSPPPSPHLLSPPTGPYSRSASPTSFGGSQGILKPAPGTFLPFSEGARACSGKKFASVEFVIVIYTLLRHHRIEIGEGWETERVEKVLKGRKAGGVTLQTPEAVPLRFVPRN